MTLVHSTSPLYQNVIDMNRLEQMEALLVQCENDITQLKVIHDAIQTIEANRQKLDVYYRTQYPKDYDEHSGDEKHYRLLNQDSIWNILTEQYDEKVKLLKILIQSM